MIHNIKICLLFFGVTSCHFNSDNTKNSLTQDSLSISLKNKYETRLDSMRKEISANQYFINDLYNTLSHKNLENCKIYNLFTKKKQKEKELLVSYLLNEYPIVTPPKEPCGDCLEQWYQSAISISQINKDEFEQNPIRWIWWNPYLESFNSSNRFNDSLFKFSKSNEILIVLGFKYNLNRNKENIKELFKEYKKSIFKLIDSFTYQKVGLKMNVDKLIATYNYFQERNYELLFEKVKLNGDDFRIIDSTIKEVVNSTEYSPNGYLDTSWYYSFWYRRYLEGNMEVVYGILNEIQAHYEKEKR